MDMWPHILWDMTGELWGHIWDGLDWNRQELGIQYDVINNMDWG